MHPGSDMRAVGGGSLGECEDCEHAFSPDEAQWPAQDGYAQTRCTDCAWCAAIDAVAEAAAEFVAFIAWKAEQEAVCD